ncbi:xylulokinase [Mycolicibacterium monacense]|uniref:Xylulose kinase n=2 Tax=Mycobacteriaceae TaxID=1762 RepID=A0AAD1IVH0_MYCMB|nr:xylulokinase [Mycolicibacterium monacense]MDA4101691.1 xylulokinase [Mycolicibacterium monacense DSM 44395]OBF48949.1 xylulokinase [Mycolicibacterium monacense]ORB13014.1 xylulokinase [Mycolicibacterium monacense DSM 44395]QHP86516.1 xylulokinase [Mycolicibacterium monacense DSM 44395]BBZ60440.1 xylulokinase [Mycolicibacterium monacense]
MTAVLGVDSSTQSCKVEIRDLTTGELLGCGSAPHPPAFPPCSEQHPLDWVSAFVAATRTALADCARPPAVCAISVAAQCHGLVLLDDHGNPLRAAKLWNDTTGAPALRALADRIGVPSWIRRTGSAPTAAFTIAKLAWVAEHEPEVLDRASTILLPHDYLTYWLTGRPVTDRSEASGTGYFDVETGQWITEYLDLAGGARDWPSMLPTVLAPCEPAGALRPAAAEILGLDGDVVVAPGGGDQHAAYLGLGLRDGDQYIGIGTSGVVATSSRTPVFDPRGMVDGVADLTGGYLPLVSTLNAARVSDVAARLLGTDLVDLADLALSAGETQGPVLVPFLDGERKPDRPDARGAFADLTSHTTRAELARAFVEGPLLSLMSARDSLRACGVDVGGAATAVGGGARSPATLQLLADLLDDEVTVLDTDEATARGACVQAAAVATGRDVAGLVDVAKQWQPAVRHRVSPRHTGRDLDALRARWAQLAASPLLENGIRP